METFGVVGDLRNCGINCVRIGVFGHFGHFLFLSSSCCFGGAIGGKDIWCNDLDVDTCGCLEGLDIVANSGVQLNWN